jgi:hypothetical protein
MIRVRMLRLHAAGVADDGTLFALKDAAPRIMNRASDAENHSF